MNLGLGLGLTARPATSSQTADWASWDGTSDGAVTNLFATNGTIGAQDIAAISDTEAVIIYEDGNDGDKWKAVVLDVDAATKTFKVESTNTAIELTGTVNLGQLLQKLTTTKLIAVCEQTDDLRVSLITKSGKTLVETDTTLLTDLTYNFQHSLKNLDSTKAIWFGKDTGNGSAGTAQIFDITGDTITVGATQTVGGTVVDYPDCCRAATGAFWVANHKNVFYCTYDGSLNITVEASLNIVVGGANQDDVTINYIDDDTCLLTYEKNGDSEVYSNTFTWTGSAVTRGTATSGIFGTNIFQGTGTSTELGNRQVMVAGRQDDDVTQVGAAVVLTVAQDKTITVGTEVTTFPSIQADHNTIDASPSGLYVFACCQDETTLPIQQVGTRVLQGF